MPDLSDVAVIVPCFNHGRFLPESVESALSQRGGPPHVLVVDDGSTEEETVRAIADLPPEVEVLRQENAGHGPARTAGVVATEQPFLCMLDADDRLAPGAALRLKRALLDDPRAGWSYGRMRFFGAWHGEIRFPDWDPYRLLYRSIVGWIGMIRREAYEQVGGFDPAMGGFEDWDFMLGALEHGWVAAQVPEVVLEYRKHETSMLEGHRKDYRRHYRQLRDRHQGLFRQASFLAADSDLSAPGRLFYRTWWAWRPLPARLERVLYGVHFRRQPSFGRRERRG
ncbi:MAG: glycosyltransferase family 2 protein [Actinobacteria bacterium]|nr:glycosyltransferase family 2 protein [Actinomycetota bacterium]